MLIKRKANTKITSGHCMDYANTTAQHLSNADLLLAFSNFASTVGALFHLFDFLLQAAIFLAHIPKHDNYLTTTMILNN